MTRKRDQLRAAITDRIPGALTRRQYHVLVIVGVILGGAVFGAAAGVVSWLDDPVQQTGSVSYSAPDGPEATFTGDYNFSGTGLFPDDHTVRWRSNQGNITLSSPSPTVVAVDQITGSQTVVSNLSVQDAPLTIDAVDRGQKLTVEGGADELRFRQVGVSTAADGEEDIYYAASSGSATLTMHGLPEETSIAAVDRNGGSILATGTTNASGAASVTLPENSHSVDVQTYDAGAPRIDDRSGTPNGSQTVDGDPVTLSVNVSDPDFPNDELDVAFTVNDTTVSTQTVTSNGEVSYTLGDGEVPAAGRHQWGITVTDQYGQTTSHEFDLLMPDELVIRNASDPGEVVATPNASVEAIFSGSNTVVERTTSDGRVSLEGLPTDEQFTATVEADGYLTRSTVIQSLVSQQTIYLLSENTSSAEIVFSLDDATGRFQGNGAQLIVERPITQNNSTSYQAVAGGEFGSTNQVSVFLENDVTYRLKVRNDDGAMRVLGKYQVSGPAQEVLPIGSVDITVPEDTSPAFNAQLSSEDGQRTVQLQYRDPSEQTESLSVEIVRADNESSVLLSNSTNVGPYGSYTETVPVPADAPDDVAYEIRYHANRGNQEDAGGVSMVGDVREIAADWNIDPQVLSLAGYIAILAMAGLVVPWRASLAPMAGSLTAIALTMFGVVAIPGIFLGLGGTTSVLIAFAGRTQP